MGCGLSLSLLPSAARGGGRDGGATAAKEPDEALGHSFRYSRSSSISGETSFKVIFGAALSANSSAHLPSLPFRSLSSSSSSSALFLSGPLDSFSGPIPRGPARPHKPSLLRRSLSEKNRPWVVPLRSFRRPDLNLDFGGQSVQWAHGKAGEDRVHVVVSEDSRWLFVGIYDGFNGPDGPEFLVSRFYSSLLLHLHGLFWLDDDDDRPGNRRTRPLWKFLESQDGDAEFDLSGSRRFAFSLSRLRSGLGSIKVPPRWKVAREEKAGRDQRRQKAGPVADHGLVLRALSRALEAAETEYMEMTDRAMASNPELALTGSCLLVVLVRDDDVYVMNLGDSRAIVAQRNALDDCGAPTVELAALQLSTDHSTSIQQEVLRIKEEHPDDDQCIVNHRVKGRLKVTRAFGAGFLKQPKWNNRLLEMFRNEYIGSAPYISSVPSLCHHKLGPGDQFLVISSDGLYQYLSNEEVVSHVEHFMGNFPDGDPAQSLIEELLSRAAKKAGMELYELLDIPQGDRRKYHDDVTVMIISLEGRIWESSGKCL